MTVVSQNILLLEGTFENYLVELKDSNNYDNADFDKLLLKFKSLLHAGYNITLKSEIDKFLLSQNQIPEMLLLDVLFIRCEVFDNLDDLKSGSNVVNQIYEILTKMESLERYNKQILVFKTDIYKCIFNPFHEMVNDLPSRLEKLGSDVELEKESFVIMTAHCLRQLGKIYTKRFEFTKAMEYFNSAIKTLPDNIFNQAINTYHVGAIEFLQGKYYKAIENFTSSSELFLSLNNLNNFSSSLIYISNCYFLNGDFETAEVVINRALSTDKIFENDLVELKALIVLGELFFYKGELNKAYNDFYLPAKKHLEKNGIFYHLASVNNKIARLKASDGEFDRSKVFIDKALDNYKEIEDKEGQRKTISFLGYCYFEKGDLESAINIWLDLEGIYKNSNNFFSKGYNYLNIAKYYLISNDNRAVTYYEKAIEVFKEKNLVDGLIESYLGYSLTLADNNEDPNKIEEAFLKAKGLITNLKSNYANITDRIYGLCLIAIEYLSFDNKKYIELELNLLVKLTKNRRVIQKTDFLQAIKLKNTGRLQDKVKSLELFEKIISDTEMIDFQTIILSYLNILEYKIFELKITEKAEVLSEINIILEELYTLTSTNELSAWSAKTLALKSQLKLLELKFDEAKKYLSTALIIAKQSNFNRLVLIFNYQYDALLTKIPQLMSQEHKNDSLSERLDFTDFKVFDSQIDHSSLLIMEEPSYISIISSSGISLYSNNFDNPVGENFDQLMSGFLIAINSVVLTLFSSSGFIERIKHKEYNIMILQLTEDLYVCYAYKGSSYSAEMRLESFKSSIRQKIILNGLLEASSKKKTLDSAEIKRLDLLLQNIFNIT